MATEPGLPVAEAARQLGVNQQRVRAMVSAGLLDARKVGGRWLVDRASLARARTTERPRGRIFAPANAWAIIAAAAPEIPGAYLEHLSAPARSRARGWLRRTRLLDLGPV